MKNIVLLIFTLSFFSNTTYAFTSSISNNHITDLKKENRIKKPVLSYKKSKEILETSLHRKLSFKEKLALRIQTAIPRYDREYERRTNNQAVTGFIFSLLGIVLLWPFLIPGYILSNNALAKERVDPGILKDGNYGLAKAGKIISLVGFGILVIALFIIIIIFSSGIYI